MRTVNLIHHTTLCDKHIENYVFHILDSGFDNIPFSYTDLTIDLIRLWAIKNNTKLNIKADGRIFKMDENYQFDESIYLRIDLKVLNEIFKLTRV